VPPGPADARPFRDADPRRGNADADTDLMISKLPEMLPIFGRILYRTDS
jgi:hypothetical protein